MPAFVPQRPVAVREGALRVLVVDDDALIRKVLCFALEKAPIAIETVCAADGAEALRLCDGEPVHMALLDVELPDTSGFELCARIRAHAKLMSVPIFMLTGRGDVDAKSEAFRAGADDYLVKPIVPEELVARAVRALERNYGVRPAVRRSDDVPAREPEAALPVTTGDDAEESMEAERMPETPAPSEPIAATASFDASFEQPVDGPPLEDTAIAAELAAAVADAAALVPPPPVPTPSILPPVQPPPTLTTSVVPAAVPPLLAPGTSEPRPPAFLSSRPPAPSPEQPAPSAASPNVTRQNAWSKFLGRSRPT